MLRTDAIYLVSYSPTSATYAHILPGPGEPQVEFYHSAKRARLFAGDLPIVPITHTEFESALS